MPVTTEPRDASSPAALAAAIAVVARGRSAEADVTEVLELAASAAGAARGAIVVWDAERDGLAVAASVGLDAEMTARLEADVAADASHPIATTAHGGAPAAAGGDGLAAWPLRVAHDGVEMPLGALVLLGGAGWRARPDVAATIGAFADLVAVAVDRARLVSLAAERSDWSERLAHTDALTGLANARTVGRVLELEVARASRQGTELSIVLFDVDGLAAANEAGGPAAGDDMLREVAAILAESVRLVDTVGRWGGDEFLLVAPGAAGMTVAQRVVNAVSIRASAASLASTVSAGVARFPADGASVDELVGAAQAALATAKQLGPGALAESGAA